MNFEEAVMPHMDAAYNLARWLTRNDADAQDMVQEAYLRALRFFSGFHGTDARAWLLTIVRNTCYTWLRRNRSPELSCDFDEVVLAREFEGPDPEAEQLMKAQAQLVNDAIEKLPIEFREVVVLRELEELSYKEIAVVLGVPIGHRNVAPGTRAQAAHVVAASRHICGRIKHKERGDNHEENIYHSRIAADGNHRRGRFRAGSNFTIQINRRHSVRVFSVRREASGREVLDQPRS